MTTSVKRISSKLGVIIFSPHAALICAVLFWSGNFIVGRALKREIPPIHLNFWRWMIALLVLLPLHYEQLYQFRTVIAKEWKIITALGLTGIAAFHICVYISLKSTTAIDALIILSTSPMVIVFGAWTFLKEHIEVSQIIGILISLLGAVILISHGRPFELLNFEFDMFIDRGNCCGYRLNPSTS